MIKSNEFTIKALIAVLQAQEQTQEVARIVSTLNGIQGRRINGYINDNILSSREPKFLYFDEYHQMTGHENINALMQCKANNQLRPSDYPISGLIHLASSS